MEIPVYRTSAEALMPVFREQLEAGHTIRFSPKGVSMLPMLREGKDSVELSPLPEKLRKYDVVLYQRDNGQYVLHRIIRTGRTYTCMGDNQFTPEPGLRRDQMIAVVTAFCREEKQYRVRHWGYGLYCRIWHYSRPLRHFWKRGIRWLRRHFK